jgi:uncharacterized protein (DUF4415 family)
MVYVGRMAKRAFEKIMAGVNEARAYLDGTADKSRYRVHVPRKRKPRRLSDDEEARVQRGIAADPDNPEWTAEDFKRAKPFAEMFPDLAASRRARGPQKEPTKVAVSLRLSRDVVERFKADGPGWQTRMDEALKKAAGLN